MRSLWILFCLALLPGAAAADIAAVTGAVVEIPTPPATELNQLESNTEIRVFHESEGVLLNATLATDASTPGLYASTASLELAGIGAGKRVNSYILHIDPVFGSRTLLGSVTFDEPILGVVALDDTLTASDSVLAAPSTSYPIPLERGLELDLNNDEFSISPDLRSVDMQFTASTALDQVRVITSAAIPVPSLSHLGLALVGTSIFVSMLVITRRRDANS